MGSSLQVSKQLASELGGQGPWIRRLPDAWAACASESPESLRSPADPTERFLRSLSDPASNQHDLLHHRLIEYWAPLLHLTVFGLGWSRPDVGLAKWASIGSPTTDRVLTVVRRWWGRDRIIDFLGWALQSEYQFTSLPNKMGLTGPPQASLRQTPFSNVLHEAALRMESTEWKAVWGGGSDALHLMDHFQTDMMPNQLQGPLNLSKSSSGRTLLLNSYDGWYLRLLDEGPSAEPRGTALVDVVVKPIGWLGGYRRSLHTRLWHRSDDEVHMYGYEH